jgi:hypothetical protein
MIMSQETCLFFETRTYEDREVRTERVYPFNVLYAKASPYGGVFLFLFRQP